MRLWGIRISEHAFWRLISLAWAVLVFTGLVLLWRYKATPGATADAPSQWPVASKIQRVSGRPTLVMFAHPQCNCTRASLAELDTLLAHVGSAVSTVVVFAKPEGTPDGWERGELWDRAAAIRGVATMVDDRGVEAARFGSKVSGQTMLYDAQGRLLFSGGITGARGHVGDNVGRERVESLISSGSADSNHSHVYGCGLQDPIAEVK